MKVVIHTRRVLEEHWDIPAAGPDISDEDIIAVCRGWRAGAQARREGVKEFDIAEPFVFSRGEADLRELGRQLAEARAAAQRAMEAAAAAACKVLANDEASERRVASELGVDRNTVRGWIGKQPRALAAEL